MRPTYVDLVDALLSHLDHILAWTSFWKSLTLFVLSHSLIFWMFSEFHLVLWAKAQPLTKLLAIATCALTFDMTIVTIYNMQREERRSPPQAATMCHSLVTRCLLGILYPPRFCLFQSTSIYDSVIVLLLLTNAIWRRMNQCLCHLTVIAMFTFPRIEKHGIPGPLLRAILPILEQLDRSMQYERRSMLTDELAEHQPSYRPDAKAEHLVLSSTNSSSESDYPEESYIIPSCFSMDESVTRTQRARALRPRKRGQLRPRLDNIQWVQTPSQTDQLDELDMSINSFDFLDEFDEDV